MCISITSVTAKSPTLNNLYIRSFEVRSYDLLHFLNGFCLKTEIQIQISPCRHVVLLHFRRRIAARDVRIFSYYYLAYYNTYKDKDVQYKLSPNLTSTSLSLIKTHSSQATLPEGKLSERLCYITRSTTCAATSDMPYAWPLLFEFDYRNRYFDIALSSLQRPINSIITRGVSVLQTKDHSYSKRPSASNKGATNKHVDQVAEKPTGGEPWFRSQIIRKFTSAV